MLSGGYEDDEDLGDVIIYTGQGGRDPASGLKVADQTLTGGNLALYHSILTGNPVRVTGGQRIGPTSLHPAVTTTVALQGRGRLGRTGGVARQA